MRPLDPKTGMARAPAAETCSSRYGLAGAPAGGARVGPRVDFEGAGVSQRSLGKIRDLRAGDSSETHYIWTPLFEEKRTAIDQGWNGFYLWASGNRLVSLQFSSAEPDEILKAYLERYPSSE